MNWFRKQKEEIIEIQVDDTERRIIVRALADLRDKQPAGKQRMMLYHQA